MFMCSSIWNVSCQQWGYLQPYVWLCLLHRCKVAPNTTWKLYNTCCTSGPRSVRWGAGVGQCISRRQMWWQLKISCLFLEEGQHPSNSARTVRAACEKTFISAIRDEHGLSKQAVHGWPFIQIVLLLVLCSNQDKPEVHVGAKCEWVNTVILVLYPSLYIL